MTLTIKNKLILNAVIAAIALAGLSWLASSGMGRMGDLQDSGFRTTLESGTAASDAHMGARLYQVIADSVINRELGKSKNDWAEAKANSLKEIDEVAKFADTAEEKRLAEQARAALSVYIDLYDKQLLPLLETTPPNQITEKMRDVDGKIDVQSLIVQESLAKVAESMKAEAVKSDEEFDGARRSTMNWFMTIAGGVIAVILLMSSWIIISITRPLKVAVDLSNRLAEGDLTAKIDASSRDETGMLLTSMQNMVEKLSAIITEVRSASDNLSSASEEVSATA